ncbi:MAG: hypothetical protein ACHQHN_10285 [Sphingobacteriales bacterium]
MGTIAYPRNIYSYIKKGHIISDFTKKIFSTSNYYGNTSYYKAVLGQYVNYASYLDIYKGTINLRSIQTDVNVQPNVLGADAGHVIAMHGKPEFVFSEKDLSIYVYKWKFNGLKTRCEVHLHKNKAFLVNYIYNQLDVSERDYILKSINQKYLDQYMHELDLVNSKISDKNSNVLFIDDYLLGLKITYLSNCESDWYEAMTAEVSDRSARHDARVRVNETRFLNKI